MGREARSLALSALREGSDVRELSGAVRGAAGAEDFLEKMPYVG